VVLATGDIQVGSRLLDRDVRIAASRARWARQRLPFGSKLIGRGVVLPIQKGEFILPSKLARKMPFRTALADSLGHAGVSVRVNEVVAWPASSYPARASTFC